MQKRGARRDQILALLAERGGLTEEAVRSVARDTGVPEADVWGAGRFYELLNHPDVDRRVCVGLSCRLAGADPASGFPVQCVAQCDRAPVVLARERGILEAGPRGGVTPSHPDLAMDLAGPDRADYAGLAKARALGAEGVIEVLKEAGLQGRGGAGFPAHFKWKAVKDQPAGERYVVCNADEGEPGTFKDREVMLRRPHLLLEGLAIAAFVAGAREIFLYIRGEFPEPKAALRRALDEAGDKLAAFDFRFVDGHGAYICGEETALIESIEGRRGLPRLKPPFPTESGLWGKPTLMNNVETLACVRAILLRGGQWFRDLGATEPGTKLYCISGHVQRPGVYELPLGATLDALVEAAGGYVGTPRAFSPGGASAGFLPMSHRRTPLDFKHLAEAGSMLGSAGVVVLNDTADLALAVLWQSEFYEHESCGQCAPCRLGTRVVRQAIERFIGGERGALEHLEAVSWEMGEGSICGLGQTAALPYTSVKKHFPETFE